jgi:O-antigen/teichoic acid export membrane protein
MAKVSAKGGFHLLWGLVLSTVISSVGTIILAGLLSSGDYGIYSIALAAPNLIINFRDWGVTTAMIKYSAQYRSENNVAKIRSIFVSGFVFEIILGLTLSIVSFTLSGFLATTFYNRPIITLLIQITSFSILAGALVNTATAAFTGMEKMHLNSIMLIIQSIFKTVLVIGLVLFGLGTLGAVDGFTLAILIAGVIGVLLAYTMYRELPNPNQNKLELIKTIKTMIRYGLPLSIGTILAGFLAYFYIAIMAFLVKDNSLIGSYSVSANFVVLITFFATPVTTMLFPAFSKLDHTKERETLKNVFQYSVKYAALIVVPVTSLVMSLAHPAIFTIFGAKYPEAPLFLALQGITYLFTALGSLSVANLINGQGYTKYTLFLTILTVVIGFPFSYAMISLFGIIGLIVATSTVGVPSLFFALRFIRKNFGVSIDWFSSVKILFSSGITGFLTYLSLTLLPFSSPVQLLLGVLIFTIIFLLIAVITRTINRSDLISIRQIANSMGPLSRPLAIFINLIEKLMNVFHT